MPSFNRLLIWPVAVLGALTAATLSASGTLSLVAAHAEAPTAFAVKQTMPAPMLRMRPVAPEHADATAPVDIHQVELIRPPKAPTAVHIGASGATLRGAAGAGAVAVWTLQPGAPVVLLARSGDWAEIGQNGLVGWVPAAALQP